jgi:hypothetical protein
MAKFKPSDLRIGNWVSDNTYTDFQVELEHLMYLSRGEDIQRIHAIDLTEDWLRRFGFKYDCYRHTKFKGVKYVHELQDLYFILTGGEDLKVK